jgi:pimeloyl-ACP methyl ester carboxylesterase
MFDHYTTGPQILVGSSMGGWLAFLLALARPERVHAIVGIAPAPDFTDQFYYRDFTDAQRTELDSTGQVLFPSDYGDPYLITQQLITEGRQHFVMDKLHGIKCPLRILHGQQDTDVPWQQSLDIAARWCNADAQVTLIKDGDHRLSRDPDLALLRHTVMQLLG